MSIHFGSWSRAIAASAVLMALAGSIASAQWTNDPSLNTKLCTPTTGTTTGDQVQAKIRPRLDGGFYVSWFDLRTPGFSVYLQRFNADGEAMWSPEGVLVATRTLSSTNDYEMRVDANGNAVLAYNVQDAIVSSAQQIAVQKVSPTGQLLFGSGGVIVSQGTLGKFTPRMAILSNGNIAVGWTSSETTPTPSGVRLQVLSPGGVPQWAAGGINWGETGRSLSMSDVQPGEDGGVIALWVRPIAGTTSARGLSAQLFSASGQPLWTDNSGSGVAVTNAGTPVVIYNPTNGVRSIQLGYFPTFQSDGQGGAVFCWYDNVNTNRGVYIQHLDRFGSPRFAINGFNVISATPASSRLRIGAACAYDAASDRYNVAFIDSNTNQSSWGVLAQRVDPTGTLEYAATGAVVRENLPKQPSFVSVQNGPENGMYVAAFESQSATASHVIAARLDATGAAVWPGSPIVLSSSLSSKARLDFARTSGGMPVAVFSDGRVTGAISGGQLFMQNIGPDGTLGPAAAPPASCNDADIAGTDGDIPGVRDGVLDNGDFAVFFSAFFVDPTDLRRHAADIANTDGEGISAGGGADGTIDNGDFVAFFTAFFSECLPG